MFTLATNQFNDLFLGQNNSLVQYSDSAALEQSLAQMLTAMTNEYVFNLQGGVNYFSHAFAKVPGWQAAMTNDLRKVALTVTGVLSVIQLFVWEANGEANFAISVLTKYGVIRLASGVQP